MYKHHNVNNGCDIQAEYMRAKHVWNITQQASRRAQKKLRILFKPCFIDFKRIRNKCERDIKKTTDYTNPKSMSKVQAAKEKKTTKDRQIGREKERFGKYRRNVTLTHISPMIFALAKVFLLLLNGWLVYVGLQTFECVCLCVTFEIFANCIATIVGYIGIAVAGVVAVVAVVITATVFVVVVALLIVSTTNAHFILHINKSQIESTFSSSLALNSIRQFYHKFQ